MESSGVLATRENRMMCDARAQPFGHDPSMLCFVNRRRPVLASNGRWEMCARRNSIIVPSIFPIPTAEVSSLGSFSWRFLKETQHHQNPAPNCNTVPLIKQVRQLVDGRILPLGGIFTCGWQNGRLVHSK